MILLANGKVITRDPNGTGYYPDGGVVTDGGKIVEEGPASQVFNEPRDPYTRMLLGAAPSLLHPKLGASA